MLLSYFYNLSKNPISIITYFAAFQSVFSPNNVHTASNTNWTIGGGLVNPFISEISFLFKLLNASSASLRAGNALSNSDFKKLLIIIIYEYIILPKLLLLLF